MKKLMPIMMTLFLIVSLCACGNKQTKDVTVDGLCSEILEKVTFDETPQKVDESVALTYYNLDADTAGEFRVYMTSGGFVDEVSVWKTSSVEVVRQKINDRIAEQKSSFENYRPEQLPKLDNAIVIQSGDYVVCCITSDSDNAKNTINAYLK